MDAMEPVFVYDRLGRRYLGHRMPKRFRILAVEIVAVPATVRRPTLDDLAELFGRDQSPRMMAMSRLPTSFLPRGGIGGRRLTEGGSDDGGLDELAEFLRSRSSKSAIRCSKACTSAVTAARASSARVLQMVGESGG